MVNNRISVILPIYNVEPYLARCVDSILCQTYSNLEIILVDDGATDGSSQLCDLLAEKDSRIVVVHKPNGGVSDARNAGLDHASGEFISFIDPDDYVAPNMLETLLFALRDNNADLSICNYLCVGDVSEGFRRFNESLPLKDEVLCNRGAIERAIFESQDWHWVVLWNKLYRRRLFDHTRFPTGKICEDEFILHKIITQCQCISCVAQPLYFYYLRTGSITQSPFKVQRLDSVEAMFHRASDLMQGGYSRKSISLAITLGINSLNRVFDYGVAKEEVYRVRYRQLLKQFRALKLSSLLKNADSIGRMVIFLISYINPYLFWLLKKALKH